MKDKIFEGESVPEALAAAAASLGLPRARLRYVVLDAGRPATAAAPGTPVRIAVLLDATAGAPRDTREAPRPRAQAAEAEPAETASGIRRLVAAVAEAGGLPLDVTFEEREDAILARLSGPGEELLLAEEGSALRALEHLAQRAYGRRDSRRIQVTSERYREHRDATLRARARELADAVRGDGVPRETEPMNAYDRRILHLAIAEEKGVRSFSVGSGAERRLTVAPEVTGPAPNPELQ